MPEVVEKTDDWFDKWWKRQDHSATDKWYEQHPDMKQTLDDIYSDFMALYKRQEQEQSILEQESRLLDTRLIPDYVRNYVLGRDNNRCIRCGSKSYLAMDH